METTIKKLLEKRKLSEHFSCYELQMIWEAPVTELKRRLNLASAEDVEYLQSLCCDLFLFYDNYKDASAMEELLKKETNWGKKLAFTKKPRN